MDKEQEEARSLARHEMNSILETREGEVPQLKVRSGGAGVINYYQYVFEGGVILRWSEAPPAHCAFRLKSMPFGAKQIKEAFRWPQSPLGAGPRSTLTPPRFGTTLSSRHSSHFSFWWASNLAVKTNKLHHHHHHRSSSSSYLSSSSGFWCIDWSGHRFLGCVRTNVRTRRRESQFSLFVFSL
jgi:hypothetical protein